MSSTKKISGSGAKTEPPMTFLNLTACDPWQWFFEHHVTPRELPLR
ncbi:MAG: hypothetical protein ACU0GG_05015 [Paracoccaceae bacterium]